MGFRQFRPFGGDLRAQLDPTDADFDSKNRQLGYVESRRRKYDRRMLVQALGIASLVVGGVAQQPRLYKAAMADGGYVRYAEDVELATVLAIGAVGFRLKRIKDHWEDRQRLTSYAHEIVAGRNQEAYVPPELRPIELLPTNTALPDTDSQLQYWKLEDLLDKEQ